MCDFRVGGGLIFGANEFVLSAQRSPISDTGVIQLYLNEPHRFFLEAIGASQVDVVNLNTGDEYPMDYDPSVKLWTGELVFDSPGLFRLQGSISNAFDAYRREINTVFISERSFISDAQTGEPILDAIVTVLQADPDTGVFETWNGRAYGQQNPFLAEGGQFGVTLPEGEYYLIVSAPGYDDSVSLITIIDQQSLVSATVRMGQQTAVDRFLSAVTRDSIVNNFALSVEPLSDQYLLDLDEPPSNVTLELPEGGTLQLSDLTQDGVPTVVYVYSNWNTLAQEQMNIYEGVVTELGASYTLIPVTTLEPLAFTEKFLGRGDYQIPLYRPTDTFYEDYMIISLPQFFLLDGDGLLVDIITGPQTAETLTRRFNEAFGP